MGLESGAGGWTPHDSEAAHDRAKVAFVTHLVSLATGVPPQAIVNGLRARGEAAQARAIAMYLMHVGFSLSQGRVAQAFQRDRSSIAHACRKVEVMREGAKLDDMMIALEECVRRAPAEVLA